MNAPTISRPGEWDAILPATRGNSHRSTTSSRHPGKAIEGNVSYEISHITTCEDCGSARRVSPHPHSPRWVKRAGVHMQIDCAGREVIP